jgi:hypothetical protein
MGAGLLVGTIFGSWLPSARRPLLIASLTLLPTVPLIAVISYAGGWLSAAFILVFAFVLVARKTRPVKCSIKGRRLAHQSKPVRLMSRPR